MNITDLDDLARKLGRRNGVVLTETLARRLGHILTAGTKGAIKARLDWGRWLCDCPFCGGAEMVSRKDRLFYCLSCGMHENAGQAMAVTFPHNKTAIEHRLEDAPPNMRQWRPEEAD